EVPNVRNKHAHLMDWQSHSGGTGADFNSAVNSNPRSDPSRCGRGRFWSTPCATARFPMSTTSSRYRKMEWKCLACLIWRPPSNDADSRSLMKAASSLPGPYGRITDVYGARLRQRWKSILTNRRHPLNFHEKRFSRCIEDFVC